MSDVNHVASAKDVELIAWLEASRDADLARLGAMMKLRIGTLPGPKTGRAWWEGALMLAGKLKASEAPSAHELLEALETKNPGRDRCLESGKVIFQSESEARGSMAGKGRRKGARLRVYECPACYGWHLTSAM